MKEHAHCMLGVCSETSKKGQTVSIYMDYDHPLLQLRRVLPSETIFTVMTRHWQKPRWSTRALVGCFVVGALAGIEGGQATQLSAFCQAIPRLKGCPLGTRTSRASCESCPMGLQSHSDFL